MRHILLLCLIFLARLASAQSDYYVKFPDDINWTACWMQSPITPPQLFNTNGANITIDYEDATFTIVPDACIKIERTWYVKSVGYDPGLLCISVQNPNPNAITNHPDNLLGPIVSPFISGLRIPIYDQPQQFPVLPAGGPLDPPVLVTIDQVLAEVQCSDEDELVLSIEISA